jgi:hypothetical protein
LVGGLIFSVPKSNALLATELPLRINPETAQGISINPCQGKTGHLKRPQGYEVQVSESQKAGSEEEKNGPKQSVLPSNMSPAPMKAK